jgi:NAD(P)H-flavin reductase/hemoglobin-like flavoprotein
VTAEQLLTTECEGAGQAQADGTVALTRSSWAVVAPRADEVARHFYATLFGLAPETRELFPVNMEVQRSRLLRALVHVVQMVDRPDEVVPFLEQLGRDHRKFGVGPEHFDAVGVALLSAVAEFAGPAWTPEVEKAWTGAYATVSGAMRTAARAERGPATWLGRVAGHRRIGWDLAIVEVALSEPIPYRAGQYVSVETPQRPRLWRYLSPANAPRNDGHLEFHVRAVPGGWVSRSIVAHSRVGDTWRIGPPIGRLHIARNNGRNVLLVAGGTGLAPIRAMLDDLTRGEGQPRVQVFIGGRTWDDLYDFAHLRRLSYANPWLDVIPVVERDDTGNGGAEIGTLSDVVPRYGSWADHDVTVCGSPAMIRSTVAQMLVAGTPLDRISYDPFTLD